jgi:uncharacterized membrane protein
MQPKRSKYDTNPLDEKVADRAGESFGSQGDAETIRLGGETTRIEGGETSRARSESEAPTQFIQDKVTSYPSVFVPPQPKRTPMYESPGLDPANIYRPPPVPPPNIYQPPPVPATSKQGTNTVAGLGIPEKWAVALPYLPFWLAIVVSIVELILVPRTETRTRFHASQALALQIVVTAISMLLTFAGLISGRFTGASLFNVVTFVFFVIAMIRVFKGKSLVVQILDEPRKFLEEKIKPRK